MKRTSRTAPSTRPPPSPTRGRGAGVAHEDIRAIDLNAQFLQARDLIERQGESLFITGKAGTGKSTLLQYLRSTTNKETVVLAPTGVAALNVGGQTIHSFFQFPPTRIDPQAIQQRRDTKLFQKLELLIIDEVSMVRADVMDGIDAALRQYRENPAPFGGVQVVLCGDLFQLPPIVRDADLQMFFNQHYGGPYFFLAHVFAELRPYVLDLTTVYRQRDPAFIEVLNKIRERRLDAELFALLKQRVIPPDGQPHEGHFLTLTTTNETAWHTNQTRLEQIRGSSLTSSAVVTGIFDPASFPTERELELKRGAQVMMLKNDPERRWVNGTLGTVSVLNDKKVRVKIAGTSHEVEPETWQNIQYHYHRETNRIEEEVIGTFTQYPMRLAWAITIHKSQGQTFDKVLIDLGRGAFAHGQTYVALSRCRSLEGLAFSRPVLPRDILFDERVHGFTRVFQPVPRC
jgi:ATP-dependent DNA helicase PIF1